MTRAVRCQPVQVVGDALAGERAVQARPDLLLVQRRQHIGYALADNVRRRQREDLRIGGVDEGVTAFAVDHDQAHAGIVGRYPQSLVTVAHDGFDLGSGDTRSRR